MSALTDQMPETASPQMDELRRVILAFSEQAALMEQTQSLLQEKVQALRRELSQKNRLLERKNRLAALGEMAAGMAHEIRNPLGGIQLYADLLAQDVADRPGALGLVQKISGGVRRLEGLVSHVLAFTREIKATIAPADLAAVVAETVELAGRSVRRKRIEVAVNGPADLVVRIDANLIGQALLNLVLNAVEAMEENGKLSIEFGPPREGLDAGQFTLMVRDDGPGIPPAILDRIFNPFFTTRDTGTGLGLAIVHRIVEAHDGSITASSVEGGGAKFEIRI